MEVNFPEEVMVALKYEYWEAVTQKGEKISQNCVIGGSIVCIGGSDKQLVLMEHKEGVGICNGDVFTVVAQSQILARKCN